MGALIASHAHRVWRILASVVLTLACAGASTTYAASLTVLVDTDNNAATGCTVATPAGPFDGVERRFITTVDTTQNPPRVTGITQEDCTAAPGTFGAPALVSAGGWAVGVGNGTSGYNVIETGLPLATNPNVVRIAVIYTDPAIGADAVITGPGGGPIFVLASHIAGHVDQVPMLSDAMLFLLVLLVAAVGWRYGRHKFPAAPMAIIALVMVTTLAWAAIVLDGLIGDWAGIPPVATDAVDAPIGVDISAVFATIEGTTLFVRVDARTGMPPAAVADNYTAVAGTTLNIASGSGLLANDTRGAPLATVTSFGGGSLGGAVTTNAAGTTATFGTGGSLTVNGDGTFSFTPATGFTGAFTFSYRLGNLNGTSDAVVTINTQQAPAFTSANATSFNVGTAGTFTVTASGVPTPTLSMTGALPAGVTFNAGTGVLSGTPAAGTAGTYPLTFTATNGVAPNATQNFTLTVTQGVAITSANATTFTVGAAGTFTVTTSSSPVAATITQTGALPAGVTFTNNGNGTATLAGTPGAGTGGTYAITITATNGVATPGTQNFTLTVNQAPVITSANAATFLVGTAGTHTVTATGFPAPTFSMTGALPAGVTFTATTGVLSGMPAAGTAGSYPLTFTATNAAGTAPQSFTLTVNQGVLITSANAVTFTVGAAGTFTVTTTSTPVAGTITVTGALPTGVTFVNNGNGTATLAGIPVAGMGGTYPLTITAGNGIPPDAVQNFVLTVRQAPAITSANAATFTVGIAGTFTVTTTGTPAAALSSTGALPAGVTFTDNGNGTATLAGTPGAGTGATYPLTFTANNGVAPNATQPFTLTVNQAPAITSAAAVTFQTGVFTTFTVTTTGVPIAGTITATGALPTGVTFVNNGNGTATLSGTPIAGTGGTYPLTITATNGVVPNATQNFVLTVNQPPAITSANAVTFTVNVLGPAFTVTTTGFPTGAAMAIGETGALPTGVTFTNNGNGTATLTGTPAAGTAGTYPITITANNGIPPNATQPFTITVIDPAVGVDDAYTVVHDTPLSVLAASGILANDTGTAPLAVTSVTGTGAPCTVFPCVAIATTNGSVTVNADGSFTYTPAPDFAGTDTFTYAVTNVAGTDPLTTVTITVTNVRPVVDLNGPAAGIDFAPTFTEGGGAVAIVDAAQLTVADTDDTQLTGATIVITNPLDGAFESLAVTCPDAGPGCSGAILAANVVYTPATHTLEILATAPLADFQVLLRTLTYNNTSVTPNATARDVTVTVNDGIADNLPLAHSIITIAGVNQAPTITAPATATTPVNTARVFAGTVSVADPDAGAANVQVTLTAVNGTATLSGTAGLTVLGNGTASVTSTGPIASQNAALNNMSFTPTTGYSGPASLQIDIDDQGNTGAGGPLTDTHTIAITVDNLPSVTTTIPTNGATAVSATATITVNFNENVTVTGASFTINCSVSGARTFTFSGSGTSSIILTPNVALPGAETCTVTVVAAQVADSALQNMAADFVFSFTVNTRPTVTTTVPTSGATAVSLATTITINFSESVTATGTAFTLSCGGAIAFTASASPASTYTLTPNTPPLPSGTLCNVNVVAAQITDVDGGQNMAADFPFSFTTGVPPSITSANATTFTVGTAGLFTVTTTGTPTVTNISMVSVTPGPGGALPTGVTFNYTTGANGTLSGTPTVAAHAGTYVVSFTATNGVPPDAVQNPFTLTLVCPAITLGPVSGTTFNATYNTAFSTPFTPAGGNAPYTYTMGGTALPAVAFTGNNLAGTPNNTGAFGFTVQAVDNFGCTSAVQNYTLNVDPTVTNDNYTPVTPVIGNVFVTSAPFSVVANDSFPAGATISAFDATGTLGGTVTMVQAAGATLGQFTYNPPRGTTGTDTFTYTLSSNGRTAVGTVSITVAGMIWFIDNNSSCASACDGRQSNPYLTLAAFNTANTGAAPAPQPGTNIFVHTGVGNYLGPLVLRATQELYGQGATAALTTLTGLTVGAGQSLPATSGARPNLSATSGTTITLAADNTLRGFNIGNTDLAGTGLAGTGFGTLTASEVSISTSGTALNLATGTAAATFDSVTSGGGVNNVNLSALQGSLTMNGGALSGASGNAFNVATGAGNITYLGTVTSGSARSVAVASKTGGTVSFQGLITDSDTGISLTGNTGATINFSGGLSLSTGANAAFTATGGGTVNATQNNTSILNTIATTTGTALNVANTTIGASDLTFRSISSNGGSATGIILDTTGASGSLIVMGNGGAGTGGTIANKTGTDGQTNTGIGIYLNSTTDPSFSWMQLNDFGNYAIRGFGVNGLTLDRMVINGTNGTNSVVGVTSNPEGSVAFGAGTGEFGGPSNGLIGSASITSSSISGAFMDNFRVVNQSGSLNRLTFDTVTIGANSTANGNDGILVEPQGSAVIRMTVNNSTFTSSRGDLLQYVDNGAGAGQDLVLTGNAFSNNHPAIATGGGGVTISSGASNNLSMNIANNSFRNSVGTAVLIVKPTGGGALSGTFNSNIIGQSGVANSGSAEGSGLKLQTLGQGTVTMAITNNQIRQYNNFGIELLAGGSASLQSGAFNTTITGNTIEQPGNTAGTLTISKNGIHLNIGTVPGDTYLACSVITGNTISASGIDAVPPTGTGDNDFRLRQRQATTIRLPGYGGANNDNAAVIAFVAANNPIGGPPVGLVSNTVPTGGGYTGTGSTCP